MSVLHEKGHICFKNGTFVLKSAQFEGLLYYFVWKENIFSPGIKDSNQLKQLIGI